MSDPPGQDSEHAFKEVCEIRTARLVLRADSEKDEDNPAIHFGDFASKDTTAEDEGLMCCEMEAAGPTNHFPRLTSTYDHSDSYELKNWQTYPVDTAADTAAAYTKERLEGREVYKTERLRRIFEWLSRPDPSTNHTEALKKHHDGTGLWFIQGDTFNEWKRQPRSFLWLHGGPGCGKTVLVSTIFEHLVQDSIDEVLLYFYFDFTDTDKQSFNSMLRSLVKQLCRARPHTFGDLGYLWFSHDQGSRRPSTESLQGALQSMLSGIRNVSIVLDALDESTTRNELLAWLMTLVRSKTNNFRLLVTSRREKDIELALQSWTSAGERKTMQQKEVEDDLAAYINDRVRNGGELERWHLMPEVQREIELNLLKKANGT
jgi:hypothetical protein